MAREDGLHISGEELRRFNALVPTLQEYKALKDNFLVDFMPILNKSNDLSLKLKYWKHFPKWKPQVYSAGDSCLYNGYPYYSTQDQDDTEYSNLSPKELPTLWTPYHSQTKEYALPWIKPLTREHNYLKNEYMVFHGKQVYQALADTGFSPLEEPQMWRGVT